MGAEKLIFWLRLVAALTLWTTFIVTTPASSEQSPAFKEGWDAAALFFLALMLLPSPNDVPR